MSTSKALRRSVEVHLYTAERALSAAATYRENHYARATELIRIKVELEAIRRVVDAHVCRVEFGITEEL